jgi:hypothetical protein
MAVLIVGAILLLAGVAFFAFTFWQRSHVRRVSGRPAGSEIHPELAPPTSPRAPQPAVTPAKAKPRESYYAVAPPNRAKGRPMGWYSVNGNLTEERFWNGRTWTARRQLVSGAWAPIPLTGS